jgi:hypothetical protein
MRIHRVLFAVVVVCIGAQEQTTCSPPESLNGAYDDVDHGLPDVRNTEADRKCSSITTRNLFITQLGNRIGTIS